MASFVFFLLTDTRAVSPCPGPCPRGLLKDQFQVLVLARSVLVLVLVA